MEKILEKKGIILFYMAVLLFVVFQMNRVEQINSHDELKQGELSYKIEE